MKLGSKNLKSLNNRAYCYAKIGEMDKALEDYDSALTLDP